MSDAFSHSQQVVHLIENNVPTFHTRAMRRAIFTKFGRIAPSIKPSVLRYFYCDLTGDASAANTAEEAELDLRVKQFIEMEPEEPGTIFDLRELKNPEKKTKYNVFWNETATYINEGVGTAVDDRRHSLVTHLSIAISIRDFREQVKARCAEGTLIPSDEWIRLQFRPKCKTAKTALQYTGRLNIRFMVQARQFRKTHEDAHYTAAIFRYVKEFAIRFREHSHMFCLDDKHRMKIGEPGFPVAAAERGRRVMVKVGSSFDVADHDFTKFSMIPSVVLMNNIPQDITESWYRGKVYVSLKDAAFESSSPIRHMTELLFSVACSRRKRLYYCILMEGLITVSRSYQYN